MLTYYAIISLVISLVLAAALMLVRTLFYKQIKRVAEEKNAELITWMLFREKWSGRQNEVLYAWRLVLYDLKNDHAPRTHIEAAERAVKDYEKRLTKSTCKVNGNRLNECVTIGGA